MSTNFYEFTYILSSTLDEEARKAITTKLDSTITSNGGEIVETDEWGLKSFAYPINKQTSGYYVNQYFNAPAAVVPAIEKVIKIDETIVRFMVLKYDNKMKKHYELAKKGALPDIFAVDVEEEA